MDLKVCYELGCCYAAEKDYQAALEAFLSIIGKDNEYSDKARVAMLAIFEILGQSSELTAEFREKLARALF